MDHAEEQQMEVEALQSILEADLGEVPQAQWAGYGAPGPCYEVSRRRRAPVLGLFLSEISVGEAGDGHCAPAVSSEPARRSRRSQPREGRAPAT